MNQLEEQLSKHWRDTNSGWSYQKNHVCCMETCNIQHVIGGVWKRKNETHVCIRSMCKDHPKWANNGTLKQQMRNLYMCCRTGQSHWCDEQCNCTMLCNSMFSCTQPRYKQTKHLPKATLLSSACPQMVVRSST